MDVFQVHEEVIADYRAFTSGFVEVRDPRIKAFVDQQFAEGVQWPDPWVSLNPSFASGLSSGTLDLAALGPAVLIECATLATSSSPSPSARLTRSAISRSSRRG